MRTITVLLLLGLCGCTCMHELPQCVRDQVPTASFHDAQGVLHWGCYYTPEDAARHLRRNGVR